MAIEVGGKTAKFAGELDRAVRARYPLIACEGFEPERTIRVIQHMARSDKHRGKTLSVWTRTKGLVQIGGPGYRGNPIAVDGTFDARGVLEHISAKVNTKGDDAKAFYVLQGFGSDVQDPMDGKTVVQLLQDLALAINGKDATSANPEPKLTTIFLLSPVWPDVPELDKRIRRLELPLPDRSELRALVVEKIEELRESQPNTEINDTPEIINLLADACGGLTEQESENALALAFVSCQGVTAETLPIVRHEKAGLIKQSAALEWIEPGDPNGLGGFDGLKNWMHYAIVAATPEAQAAGLDPDKGIVCVGQPGCGKSYAAEIFAAISQRVLVRLDMGSIMGGGGGIIGQAEMTMKKVISICNTVGGLILMLDEIDKNMTGLASSGQTDAGTTSRVIGMFMTWQAEQRETLVWATANDITKLDAAQTRIGRFDQRLFFDLPRSGERAEIVAVHLVKKQRDPALFDLNIIARATEGFSGAELKKVVQNGIRLAFLDGKRPVTTGDLLTGVSEIVPMSRSETETVAILRGWARDHNALVANSPEPEVEEDVIRIRPRSPARPLEM